MKLAWRRLDGRDGHTVGRELLRELVGELPPILVTDRGKPYFADGSLCFSIAHTKNHAFCCVSENNVGMDAEEADRPVSPALRHMCSAAELARCGTDADLLRLWVLKESWAKLTGRGIGNYLKETDFRPNDGRITQIDGCFVAVMEE